MANDRQPLTTPTSHGLPELLRPLFWDYDFDHLDWREHRDLVTGRILSSGGLDPARWLRKQLGDREIREWILRRQGRGLSPRRLRFWELILDLPSESVDAWLAARMSDPWERRHRP